MKTSKATDIEPADASARRGSLIILGMLFRRYPGKCLISVGNLSLAGLLEGIGIAALLPTLALVLGSEQVRDTKIDKAFQAFFELTGFSRTIEFMLVLIVFVTALKAIVKLLATRQVAHAASYVVADNRFRLIRASMAARWDHFISLSSGKLTNAVSVESQRAANFYVVTCKLFADGSHAVLYMVVALAISWQVTIASAAVGALMFVLLYRLVELTRRAGHTQTVGMTAFTTRIVDSLAGMKPLKSMGGEERLMPLLTSDIRLLQRTFARLIMLSSYVRITQEPIAVAALAAGVYMLLVVWAFPFEALLILAFLFMRTVGSFNSIQRSLQNMAAFEAPFWLVEDMTNEALRSVEDMSGRNAPEFRKSIEFRDVSFGYGDHVILEEASFELQAGKFVTITGPSGVGKTTTADLIIALFRPASGKILIDGLDLADCDLAAWRRQIGYVPQETYLFHDSIAVNVTLGEASIDDGAVETALRQAGAWEFVNTLPDGMHSVVGERGGRLSGGQRQRIAIARALVRAPKLLVLDEPTTALDETTEASIVASLRELAGKVTILAVSHQPALISAADKVFDLKGRTLHELPVLSMQLAPGQPAAAGMADAAIPANGHGLQLS